MQAKVTLLATALFLWGTAVAAHATEDGSLAGEIESLRRQADALEAQRSAILEREVSRYLEIRPAASAEGAADDLWSRLRVHASLTGVFLFTAGAEVNSHAAGGDLDLFFDFAATPNLDILVHMTANAQDGRYDGAFGAESGFGGTTLAGATDGMGVDGTVSTAPGAVAVYEAAIHWRIPVSDRTVHLLLGKLDPRNYFGQTAFTENENTQFLNNAFDDPTALSFPTNAFGGSPILGIHGWIALGERAEYRVDVAWYNASGPYFDNGIAFWQIAWNGEFSGREANIRLYGQVDSRPSDISAAVGVAGDWWATDKIGVFLRFTWHDNHNPSTGEPNQLDVDWTLGAMARGLVASRPEDTCGVALAIIRGPVSEGLVIPGAPESHEAIVELYYRFVYGRSKLEVTPLAQVLIDPGAGSFLDDLVVLLGVRIHASF